MENSKTSVFQNSLIWFGAAVSIAEILTGTFIAPLGFKKGISAILLGHLIGCVLLYFAGLIGANTEKSAMETVKISFGQKGSVLFSSMNVLQLIGWTAVMIFSGKGAANVLLAAGDGTVWGVAIGALILVWILIGITNLGKINTIAMTALFMLTMVLSVAIFKNSEQSSTFQQGISFGGAVELSAAMPLSWLPLISDYTRYGKDKKATAFASSGVYFVTSSWMYIIGMGAAILTGKSDIAAVMADAGLGVVGLAIIIFSTVTTTFLDVYSAGVSTQSISLKLKEKPVAIAVCIAGTALAIFTPVTQLENFLYFIGSVFAPMIAIQITDVFLLKKDHSGKNVNWQNILVWTFGFIVYRKFITMETVLGSTLPAMLVTMAAAVFVNFLRGKKRGNNA